MWLFTLLNDWGLYLRYGFHVPPGVWVATFIRRDRGCLYFFYTERTCSLDSFLDSCYFTALQWFRSSFVVWFLRTSRGSVSVRVMSFSVSYYCAGAHMVALSAVYLVSRFHLFSSCVCIILHLIVFDLVLTDFTRSFVLWGKSEWFPRENFRGKPASFYASTVASLLLYV